MEANWRKTWYALRYLLNNLCFQTELPIFAAKLCSFMLYTTEQHNKDDRTEMSYYYFHQEDMGN